MRIRNTTRWGVGKIYPAPEYFTEEEVIDGLHTIQLGNQFLDILIRNRHSPVTVVTFQHRISVRSTFPTLVGEGITGATEVNLIAVSDPSVSLSNDVRLGWYLGNRAIGKLRPILAPLIDTAVSALGTERLIFFGNSGGGIPALQYAARHDGAIALTVNPALGINSLNEKDFEIYMRHCHPRLGRTAYRRVWETFAVQLISDLPREAKFYAAMYHNINDREYYLGHQKPFVDSRCSDLQVYQRLEEDTPGHTPIPKEKLQSIIQALANIEVCTREALANAEFLRV